MQIPSVRALWASPTLPLVRLVPAGSCVQSNSQATNSEHLERAPQSLSVDLQPYLRNPKLGEHFGKSWLLPMDVSEPLLQQCGRLQKQVARPDEGKAQVPRTQMRSSATCPKIEVVPRNTGDSNVSGHLHGCLRW